MVIVTGRTQEQDTEQGLMLIWRPNNLASQHDAFADDDFCAFLCVYLFLYISAKNSPYKREERDLFSGFWISQQQEREDYM